MTCGSCRHVRERRSTRAHTHIHKYMHTNTHTTTHTHTHSYTHTHKHTHKHTHTARNAMQATVHRMHSGGGGPLHVDQGLNCHETEVTVPAGGGDDDGSGRQQRLGNLGFRV